MEKKTIAVLGMMCAGCVANVERKLNSLDGVVSASVSLPSRTALVEYDENKISLSQMKDALAGIGYDMVIEDDRNVEAIEQRAYQVLVRKVALSWLFAALTMGVSMHWIDIGGGMDTANQAMLILSLLNLVYCGRQFFVNAWRQLTHMSASMDSLVALSVGVSFLFSVFNTCWGEAFWSRFGIMSHTYYDASVMIVTFVLTGRLMEEKAKRSTASAIRKLMGLAPKTARVVGDDGLADVPVSALQKGDVIEVRPGERLAVDGRVVSGEAYIDESMISGEPTPVHRADGDAVLGGTMVRQGTVRFKAEKVGNDTMLAGIIRMVQQAQGSKAPMQRMVDRIALVFVPTVVCISLLTFVLWTLFGGMPELPRAVVSAVSVLVIACPCALGLATPTALMVGIGKAAEMNMLIKDATALEGMCRIDAIVMDKTGTLTIPNKEVDFTSPDSLSLDSRETLKPHAAEAVARLRSKGIEVYMMSGDNDAAARYWAEKADIAHWQSKVMPQDKEDLVRKLQGEGHHVAMVGDGINDSQALAAADVSIAIGTGTDIAIDTAQVTLMGDDLRRIPDAFDLSRRTVGMIRQNLFWAFVYNVVCIPLAAGLPAAWGSDLQITPMWGSALMAMSSVSVVLNSLRLRWA